MTNEISVDIVIPTQLKDSAVLEKCLESLAASDTVLDDELGIKSKVIVVVNATQVEMVSAKKQLAKHKSGLTTQIEWIALGRNKGFTGAVNEGAAHSDGELIVLLNDDTVVSKTWLKELVLEQQRTKAQMVASRILTMQSMHKPFEEQEIDSLGFTYLLRGKAIPITSDQTIKDVSSKVDYWLKYDTVFKDMEEPFGPDGAAALYTRELWEQLGGMRPGFFAYLEDVDFAWRARRHGARCTLASSAVVYHLKHGTSKNMTHFKVKQDMLNWWRIVVTYPLSVWFSFGLLILVERMRNFSGFAKSFMYQQK